MMYLLNAYRIVKGSVPETNWKKFLWFDISLEATFSNQFSVISFICHAHKNGMYPYTFFMDILIKYKRKSLLKYKIIIMMTRNLQSLPKHGYK